MKKIIEFLSAPVISLIVGLVFYLWVGCCTWQYDGFDRKSAFYGGLFVIAIDILFYGYNALYDSRKSKKNRQDFDG